MKDTFTKYDINSIIYLGDEEDMLPRYHNENAIYLYCVLERETANKIINKNVYITPIVLYETPQIAKVMAKNVMNPVTLRIAVNTAAYNGEYYYDKLTMSDEEIKKRFKTSINEYKSKCVYTRELVNSHSQQIIQYTINKADKLLINPQYI